MRAPTAQNKVISCLRTCNQIQLPVTLRFAEIWKKMLTDCLADAKSKAEEYYERCRRWLADFFGAYIPEPNEQTRLEL